MIQNFKDLTIKSTGHHLIITFYYYIHAELLTITFFMLKRKIEFILLENNDCCQYNVFSFIKLYYLNS